MSWVKPTKPEAQNSGVRAAPKSDDYDEVDQNEYAEVEALEKVMNQVIFNGGVDYEYALTLHCHSGSVTFR